MKSTETNHLPGLSDNVHGSDGPLHVTYGGHQSSLGKEFLDAAGEACPEIPFQHDIQDGKTANAKTNWGKWIHPKTGRRQDTAHGYLHPAVNKSEAKVHVLCECTTTRVIFESNTITSTSSYSKKKAFNNIYSYVDRLVRKGLSKLYLGSTSTLSNNILAIG